MAYATVRRLGRLQALAEQLNARRPPPRLAALQWVALGQLQEPLRPPAVIVDQAVIAARGLSRAPGAAAAGFLNATLRRFLRDRERLLETVMRQASARHDYPDWWLQKLMLSWPAQWEQVAQIDHQQAPLALRVNRRHITPEAYQAVLAQAGMSSRHVGPEAIVLDQAVPVDELPGFARGDVSVQDPGAQLAAHFLDLAPGQRVLDACAAPGGKTCHILELADVDLVALDIETARCTRIHENLKRCALPVPPGRVRVLTADAAHPERWWDGQMFDRILLDAPCSASGIVRRHPDIPWLRRRGDLNTLAQQQSVLLYALWPLLRPGGKLVYATCSIFPEEGDAIVTAFVQAQPDSERVSLSWTWADGSNETVAQLLPTSGLLREHDGFFYACLTKKPVH